MTEQNYSNFELSTSELQRGMRVQTATDCETDVSKLRVSLLAEFRRYADATSALRYCSLDSPDLEKKCTEWETARNDLEEHVSYWLPSEIRDPLLETYGIRDALVLSFKSREPEKYSLCLPHLEFVEDQTGKGDTKEHRFRACDNVYKYLYIKEWQPEWPDVDAAIAKVESVFDKLKHDDLSLKAAEVKTIVFDQIKKAEIGLRHLADSASGISRHLLKAHAPYAPPRGVLVDELMEKVRQVEPAMDHGAFYAAVYDLEQDDIIQKEDVEITDLDTQERIAVKSWRLTKSARGNTENDTANHFDTINTATVALEKKMSEKDCKRLSSIPNLNHEPDAWATQVPTSRLLIKKTGNSTEDEEAAKNMVGSLRQERSRGLKDNALTVGIDTQGRVWRRDPQEPMTLWYLISSLGNENWLK